MWWSGARGGQPAHIRGVLGVMACNLAERNYLGGKNDKGFREATSGIGEEREGSKERPLEKGARKREQVGARKIGRTRGTMGV